MILKTPLTPKSSRFPYYARSLGTLASGLRPSLGALQLMWRRSLVDPQVVTLRSSALRFLVRDRMDVWGLKEVCLDRDYERVAVPIENGWTIVDVGAGIGEFAIDIAARHPGCVVHAFEPSPSAYDLLRRNVALNHVRNVHTHPAAIGSRDATLDVSGPSTVFHRLVEPGGANEGSGLRVAVWPLDVALRDIGVAQCDFLKMDCEGGEFDILLNAPADVLGRIARICLEYHDRPGRSHERIVARLTAEGFAVRLTENPAYRELGYLYASRA